jgi:hypothetical protein
VFVRERRPRVFVLNRYQLPDTLCVRGNLFPEYNLFDASNSQRLPTYEAFREHRPTDVPSWLDPHQFRSRALFVEPQNILSCGGEC